MRPTRPVSSAGHVLRALSNRVRWDTGSTGRPVVFISGALGTPDRLYGPLLSVLGGSVAPVLQSWAVDAPGTAPSDYELLNEIRLVEESVRQLRSERFDIVAFSGGCTGAIQFSCRYPERIRSLTLIEPAWLGNTTQDPLELDYLQALDRAVDLRGHEAINSFCAALVSDSIVLPKSEGHLSGRKMRALLGLRTAWRTWRQEDMRVAALEELRAPVYLPTGGNSSARMRSCAQMLSGYLPQARIDTVPDSHHLNILHSSSEILGANLLDFWTACCVS